MYLLHMAGGVSMRLGFWSIGGSCVKATPTQVGIRRRCGSHEKHERSLTPSWCPNPKMTFIAQVLYFLYNERVKRHSPP